MNVGVTKIIIGAAYLSKTGGQYKNGYSLLGFEI